VGWELGAKVKPNLRICNKKPDKIQECLFGEERDAPKQVNRAGLDQLDQL
jgi:hypothetical protein